MVVVFILHVCSFAFGFFACFIVFLFNVTARWKTCSNVMLFLGNPNLLSLMLRGPVVPLVCGFTQ